VDIITNDLNGLQAPPAPKRFKDIWNKELELDIQNEQALFSPEYSEIKRRKRKKSTVKPKRKIKKKVGKKKR
jgi:hypothetical protein